MKTRLLTLVLFIVVPAIGFAAEKDKGFVAHEWGTFTSVQGADGVQMEWNPLNVSELPSFVYERNAVRSKTPRVLVASKTGMTCRQRMETPVIYFYTDRERTVDVSVNFPQGIITEWYPQESAADVGMRTTAQGQLRPQLRWSQVQLLAPSKAEPVLPQDPSGSHYYAARQTDAAFVRVAEKEHKAEVEKFLFYRGTGNFDAPLNVKLDRTDPQQLTLTNTGSEELRHLFVYEVRDGGGSWQMLKQLKPGETQMVELDPAKGARPFTGGDRSLGAGQLIASPRLNTELVDALVAEGLYRQEAIAMVKTWEDSWFSEKGLRVLYTLPRTWTDRTLPLKVVPTPQETARVMVGRAEVITPAMEISLLQQMERYVVAEEADRPKIIEDTRALGIGRFMEATLRRVIVGQQRSPEFSSKSWELLQMASMKVKPPVQSAGVK
jgi:hypothetical protein